MEEYIILMPMGIQLLGLLLVVLNDKYIRKEQKQTMTVIIGLISLLLAQNVVDNILGTTVSMPYLRTVVSIVGYSVRPIIIVMFCKLVRPNGKNTVAWVLVILNALIYLSALFSRFVFYIDPDNHFHRGSIFNYTAYVVSFILLAHLIYCTISEYKSRKSFIWIALINAAIIVISAILEITPAYFDYPVGYLTIAIVCCSLFYYIWLHLEFVREHERALMAEQRIKIMMSQIQPHFVSNTLTTIQSLCMLDPPKAAEITGKFGAYIRNNIASLDEEKLIPIKKEIEHTKIYTEIEMLRFPDISVEYEIDEEDFSVPALTVQPLVENAIRHGVREIENGKVSIVTKNTEKSHIITIRDNGVGFDTDTLSVQDGAHIGINNVRERVKAMCGGTLAIDSQIGKGTTVTITIPRRTA
ncbi:MAG: histidine kinase [Eubacterium sp.]|nr:histidine kinase [Eubacterium sp.]